MARCSARYRRKHDPPFFTITITALIVGDLFVTSAEGSYSCRYLTGGVIMTKTSTGYYSAMRTNFSRVIVSSVCREG